MCGEEVSYLTVAVSYLYGREYDTEYQKLSERYLLLTPLISAMIVVVLVFSRKKM